MSQLSPFSSEVFDSWAEVYDTLPNPLLSLEQRVLDPKLVDIRGLDILDAGCGTGRWLHRLLRRAPRSLLGVDISPEMLLLAADKLNHNCDLRLGSCTALPVDDASADVVLCSFVLSYLDDLQTFAREIDRVARPGATVFLTDMHPDTEASLHWKRSFSANGSDTQIATHRWSLQQIAEAFQARGFNLRSLMEPTFGTDERHIFEERGRPDLYVSAGSLPAIYVLQLRKPPGSPRQRTVRHDTPVSIRLQGARCAAGPDSATPASVSVVGGIIHQIQKPARTDENCEAHSESVLDLSDFLVLPGLINAHDHLEFSLFPNIGDGPYRNSAQWAADIHANHAHLIAQHRKLPRSLRLWWGAIRNLLCGVTTVCHHNPVTRELLNPGFPLHVVSDFGWAHSPSMEPDLAAKFAQSRADLPFILHAAEGVDEESMEEVFALDRIQALDDRTVLVHGLACTPEAVSLINRRLAAVVLCPTSNEFLFHQYPSLGFIDSLDNVVLGSDSPLTAAGDLLDEVRFAHQHIGLDAGSLYAMVTNRPAEILRLRRGEGRLRPGSIADVLVVRDIGLNPAETLAQLITEQIEMVMIAGRIQLVGPSLFERLPTALRLGLQPFEVDGRQLWVRAPIDQLLADAEEALGADLCIGGKRVRRAPAA